MYRSSLSGIFSSDEQSAHSESGNSNLQLILSTSKGPTSSITSSIARSFVNSCVPTVFMKQNLLGKHGSCCKDDTRPSTHTSTNFFPLSLFFPSPSPPSSLPPLPLPSLPPHLAGGLRASDSCGLSGSQLEFWYMSISAINLFLSC